MSTGENGAFTDAPLLIVPNPVAGPVPTEHLGWETELARQIAREMSDAYESTLELNPGLHAVGAPRAAGWASVDGPGGSGR
ncbi:hypothetical protein [Micromonospora okii]|uniref:hypothetical protein n=1 Tax=Micromonospora okii TaxID=1182970 RepID=UPI001E46575F|nr:hypothetical protein [Micromonospora okii]